MIKENTIAVAGRVGGVWNNETKKYEVIRKTSVNGKRYQLFEISISRKNDDDTWTNGGGFKVQLWGDTEVKDKMMVGIRGKLQPSNWTNKEGKEIKGFILNAFNTDMFTPEKWEAQDKPAQKEVW